MSYVLGRWVLGTPMPELALPWGSQSTSSTFLPIRLRAAERFTVVVVLPTPPFWFAIAMIFAIGHMSFLFSLLIAPPLYQQ